MLPEEECHCSSAAFLLRTVHFVHLRPTTTMLLAIEVASGYPWESVVVVVLVLAFFLVGTVSWGLSLTGFTGCATR